MSEAPIEASSEAAAASVGSAEGSRLFVDLGAGAGAIPVRAQEGRSSLLKSSFAGVSVFMAALAAVAIFGMRKLGTGVRSAAADVPITLEAPAAAKVDSGRFEQLMAELEAGDRPVQVDASKLGRSPFELAVAATAPKVESAGETEEQRAARLAEEARLRAEAERKRLIETTLNGLKLHGVVGGRVPAAKINTQIVRVGDTVADLFVVKQILARSVVLEVDEVEYELTMGGSGRR